MKSIVVSSTGPELPLARGYAHQLNPEFLVEKEGLKAKLFDGKKLANTINREIEDEIKQMTAQGNR
jgi:hypothetical protein